MGTSVPERELEPDQSKSSSEPLACRATPSMHFMITQRGGYRSTCKGTGIVCHCNNRSNLDFYGSRDHQTKDDHLPCNMTILPAYESRECIEYPQVSWGKGKNTNTDIFTKHKCLLSFHRYVNGPSARSCYTTQNLRMRLNISTNFLV